METDRLHDFCVLSSITQFEPMQTDYGRYNFYENQQPYHKQPQQGPINWQQMHKPHGEHRLGYTSPYNTILYVKGFKCWCKCLSYERLAYTPSYINMRFIEIIQAWWSKNDETF